MPLQKHSDSTIVTLKCTPFVAIYMADPQQKISQQDLDRICWLIMSGREDFIPPKETAEDCIDHHENTDQIDLTEHDRGYEYGYHAGMVVAYEQMSDQLRSSYAIDIKGRAERYVRINREAGIDLSLETSAETGNVFSELPGTPKRELESLEHEPYTIENTS